MVQNLNRRKWGLGTLQPKLWWVAVACRSIAVSLFHERRKQNNEFYQRGIINEFNLNIRTQNIQCPKGWRMTLTHSIMVRAERWNSNFFQKKSLFSFSFRCQFTILRYSKALSRLHIRSGISVLWFRFRWISTFESKSKLVRFASNNLRQIFDSHLFSILLDMSTFKATNHFHYLKSDWW